MPVRYTIGETDPEPNDVHVRLWLEKREDGSVELRAEGSVSPKRLLVFEPKGFVWKPSCAQVDGLLFDEDGYLQID